MERKGEQTKKNKAKANVKRAFVQHKFNSSSIVESNKDLDEYIYIHTNRKGMKREREMYKQEIYAHVVSLYKG